MKTLIVEDEFISRKILLKIVTSFSEADIATDGLEALDAFKFASEEDMPYDLVLLDIMMPGMDGQEVLKEIRNFEKEKKIFGSDAVKVIMTTGKKDSANVMQAFRSQCEGYIVKPVKKNDLIEKLNELGYKV